MFEVLAFVFENYWSGEACPELPALQRKLNAVGFDDAEIQEALLWLAELQSATHGVAGTHAATPVDDTGQASHTASAAAASPTPAMRVFTPVEQARLGREGWGLMVFLVSVGALPWYRLELVMDRVMATPTDDLSVDDLKLIVLMVFWSLGDEPDALVADELCDNHSERVGH